MSNNVTKKTMISSLAAATLLFASLGGAMIGASADGAAVAQSATALEQKTYSIDWETLYGENGFVVIGDANKTYYSDMYEGSDGTAALTTSSWQYTQANFTDFTAKSTAPISTLSYGTVVWGANGNAQSYNLYKPGTNKTERLKTRAHQNANSKYYSDVFAGFTLKEDSDMYVTLNVSDHANKVSANYPITVSVYASSATKMNAEAYADNKNPERYQLIDDFYAGKGGSALASTTVTQQSANVTFKLQGKGEYRIVAYYNNPTAVDAEVNMVTTGTNSPVLPQINGFFFDADNPLSFVAGTVDYATSSGNWQGVYGNDAYVIMDYDRTANKVDEYKVAYTKGIYTKEGAAYTGKTAYTDASTKYSYKDTGTQPEWQATDASLTLSNEIVTRYGLNANNWEWKSWLSGTEESNGDLYSANQLKKPDSAERVAVRVGGPNTGDQGASTFAFTISENAVKNGSIFVTVYNNNSLDGYKDNATYSIKLYNQYYSANKIDQIKIAATASATATSVKNTNFYTTFEIREAGDWCISVQGESGKCRGAIQAIFFDKTKPAPSSAGTYSIQYVIEDGENAASNPSSYTLKDGVASFEKATTSRPDAVFEGWYQDQNKTSKPVSSLPAGMNVDITLYAKFVSPCIISYDVGDGTNHAENPVKAASGDKITLKDPTAPAHHYFDGWFTTADFDASSRVTGEYTVDVDVTFYAKFTEVVKYTITYVLDGGVNAASNPATYYSGEGVAEFASATKDGFTFEGWYFDEEFEQEITMIPSSYTDHVTLYAKFVKNPVTSNITYVLDGGVNAAGNPATYTEGEAVTLADATKEGHTFDGWYTDSAFTNKVTGISAETTGDETLYAKFIENQSSGGDSGSDSGNNGDSGNAGDSSDNGNSSNSGEKKGCNGSVAFGVPALVMLAAGIVAVMKKKED